MEETYTTSAIILSRELFRENDSRAVIYSPDLGKLVLIARGTRSIKSKLAGHIEPMTLSRIMVVKGKKLNYIGAAVGENYFANLKNNYESLGLAGNIANLFNSLLKEGDNNDYAGLFDLLRSYLFFIDQKGAPTELVYSSFLLKMLNFIGYKPELANCLDCGHVIMDDRCNFDYSSGGLICAECLNGRGAVLELSHSAVESMRLFPDMNVDLLSGFKISIDAQNECKNTIEAFYKYNFID
jgi:DNA repair protein RecO (recombination protein O)